MKHYLLPIILGSYATFYAPMTLATSAGTDEINIETPMIARGVLVPNQTADIAAGMSGKLLSAPYKAGRYVKAGQAIARFDCARQEADLEVREQAHQTLALKYNNQNELLSMGAAGELDVQIAKSERDQISAEIRAIKVALKDCVVTAPFAGYVATRHVSAHETPQIGQPLYSLIRAGTAEMSVIAPSHWVRWMKVGTQFEFKVDETGETFTAKIERLSPSVDPVSQTIEVTARPAKSIKAKPGMSGIASFSAPPKS
ncbi:efflux RND transporter periplasmic adaptor subunit [Litorimonas sp. RW-G-Af-16]|uniref:efflux RND transporter periplasmic adaptor subunit n=1 Tax=Litorimonas sp. RW-G-Af-16 TaxID=3241168 RepID=UPI00390CC333